MLRWLLNLFSIWKSKTAFDAVDAVILVDMQDRFVSKIRRGRAEIIIEKQLKVIEQCAVRDVPVAVLEYEECGATIPVLMEALQKVPRVIFEIKSRDSGFTGTCLGEQLFYWQARVVLLMGVNAQHCVRETAGDAIRMGYSIVTAPDLIAGPKEHDAHDDLRWYQKHGSMLAC